MVLQQALRDLDTAYRNFFDALKGKRPRTGAPRFESKRDTRQAVRFTANARRRITTGGDLSLPKIGNVRVTWSRALPSVPSSVTVAKDSAERYFASFVVETGRDETLPETTGEVGVDLGFVFRLMEGVSVPRPGLVGPWSHKYPHLGVPGPAIGFLQQCVRWWDRRLKGVDNDIMSESTVRTWMRASMPPPPPTRSGPAAGWASPAGPPRASAAVPTRWPRTASPSPARRSAPGAHRWSRR
ncbi:RNA-guided endonuclease InsQ/TnpB family protein [Streptomonospora salina]|uniref:Transposase n=1 Tax=Streptomonospora salina TaxID=104205 RepID=A0A841DZX8_9ACTN|nr:hypothetical protein [Streptomonospora salina]MBB5996346.1 hypothetical protein [Streptomonospora salina]